MFLAAARTIAELPPAKRDPRANLLPPLRELRKLSFQVAIAVAKEAESEGLALPVAEGDLVAAVKSKMWEPLYATYQRLRKPS
jgi:malate dehydrogenase (oxaloacetate-decarboxylating)